MIKQLRRTMFSLGTAILASMLITLTPIQQGVAHASSDTVSYENQFVDLNWRWIDFGYVIDIYFHTTGTTAVDRLEWNIRTNDSNLQNGNGVTSCSHACVVRHDFVGLVRPQVGTYMYITATAYYADGTTGQLREGLDLLHLNTSGQFGVEWDDLQLDNNEATVWATATYDCIAQKWSAYANLMPFESEAAPDQYEWILSEPDGSDWEQHVPAGSSITFDRVSTDETGDRLSVFVDWFGGENPDSIVGRSASHFTLPYPGQACAAQQAGTEGLMELDSEVDANSETGHATLRITRKERVFSTNWTVTRLDDGESFGYFENDDEVDLDLPNGKYNAVAGWCGPKFYNSQGNAVFGCTLRDHPFTVLSADFNITNSTTDNHIRTFAPRLASDGDSFRWLVDGQEISTTRQPTHRFLIGGLHSITLELTNSDGQTVTVTKDVDLDALRVVIDSTSANGLIHAETTPGANPSCGADIDLEITSHTDKLWQEVTTSGEAGIFPTNTAAHDGMIPPGEKARYSTCFHNGGDIVGIHTDAFSDRALMYDAMTPMFTLLSIAGVYHDLDLIDQFKERLPVEVQNINSCLVLWMKGGTTKNEAWVCFATNFIQLFLRPGAMDELTAAVNLFGDIEMIRTMRQLLDSMRTMSESAFQTMVSFLDTSTKAANRYSKSLGQKSDLTNKVNEKGAELRVSEQSKLAVERYKNQQEQQVLPMRQNTLDIETHNLQTAQNEFDEAESGLTTAQNTVTRLNDEFRNNGCTKNLCPQPWADLQQAREDLSTARGVRNAARTALTDTTKKFNTATKALKETKKNIDDAVVNIAKWEDRISDTKIALDNLKLKLNDVQILSNLFEKLLIFWEQSQTMKEQSKLLGQNRRTANLYVIACANTTADPPACTN